MGEAPPTVYILHGEDDLGIAQFIHSMQEKMGDPAMAELNSTRLDGSKLAFGELENAVSVVPFLSSRRLIILDQPLNQLKRKEAQEKFKDLLQRLPPTSALVLVENRLLKPKHWILKWAQLQEGRAWVKAFQIPRGAAMARWIRQRAREQGGKVTPQGAAELARLVADDKRRAAQEIDKLLAYVNYDRAVEIDDVFELTLGLDTGDVFKMVDAIGNHNGKVALEMLHKQLAEKDPLPLFSMIVRQFRLLLLMKEMQASGVNPQKIAKELKQHDFVVRKLANQSRNFDLGTLEAIYFRLGETDERIKTGRVDAEIALDTLIAGLTL